MTVASTAAAIGLWVVIAFLGYLAFSYTLLFHLSTAERLPDGAIADAVFVATLPFVLMVTWFAAVRD